MSEYWIVYDASSGAEWFRGSGPQGTMAIQEPAEGGAIIEVPSAAISGVATDLQKIRLFYAARIDAEAEGMRALFITPGSGQALTYIRKEAEARAYVADNGASTPLLTAEASATGVTVADLAATVIASADQWTAIGAQIEALRIGAKQGLSQAANLLEIAQAAAVDWSGLLP